MTVPRVALALALAAGCYDPTIAGGGLRCSKDGECPDGYYCAGDSSCWKTGEAPPPTVPGAPRAVRAQTSVRSATVSWFMPASNGGSAITAYQVTASPGGAAATAAGDATSATLTGLLDGTSYTFTVVATNAVGDGPPASAGPQLVPGPPFAPLSVAASPGVRSAVVTWHASADDGSPVLAYLVTASPGGATATVAGDATSAVVEGLANGAAYVFSVTASNAVGTGASGSSPTVTTPDVPQPPSAVRASPAVQSLAVDWAPPSSNGGESILGYTVATVPEGGAVSMGAYTATVRGLASDTAYRVSVFATNAVGDGAAASAGPVVPQ
ncbi:MAG: fibronectin type III domain-containing protein [Myxococcales bacterium]